jgi:uncharacterized damage-inducible protein DinB
MVSRKEINVPEYYQRYVDQAGDDDLQKAFKKNSKQLKKLLKDIPGKKHDYAYAAGKWTIRELLQHVVDAERVFVIRALWFTRKDPSPLPGFEENIWAAASNARERKWDDLVKEFFSLRAANALFFQSLNDDQLRQTGIASGNTFNVVGLGFITVGHVAHHMNVLKERYLNKGKKEKKEAALPLGDSSNKKDKAKKKAKDLTIA